MGGDPKAAVIETAGMQVNTDVPVIGVPEKAAIPVQENGPKQEKEFAAPKFKQGDMVSYWEIGPDEKQLESLPAMVLREFPGGEWQINVHWPAMLEPQVVKAADKPTFHCITARE